MASRAGTLDLSFAGGFFMGSKKTPFGPRQPKGESIRLTHVDQLMRF